MGSQGEVHGVPAVGDPDDFQPHEGELPRQDLLEIPIILGKQDPRP